MADTITCPTCGGKPLVPLFAKYVEGTPKEDRKVPEIKCPTCEGLGTVTQERLDAIVDGQRIRTARLARQLGPRRCAEAIGILPSDLLRAENGGTTYTFRDEVVKKIEALGDLP